MITRREFFLLTGSCAGSAAMCGCSAHNLLLKIRNFSDQDHKQYPALYLTTSINQEYEYDANIEGMISAMGNFAANPSLSRCRAIGIPRGRARNRVG
jgi:hypothetical protein